MLLRIWQTISQKHVAAVRTRRARSERAHVCLEPSQVLLIYKARFNSYATLLGLRISDR